MSVSPSAVRIKKASGWQDMAIVGPPGPPGAMTLIAEQTLGAAGIFDFQNIPQTYTHLKLVLNIRAVANIATSGVMVRFNGSSGANYNYHVVYGVGAAAPAQFEGVNQTWGYLGTSPGSALADSWSSIEIMIPRYRGTGMKHWSGYSYAPMSGAGGRNDLPGGLWWLGAGTPITNFQVFSADAPNTFVAGSVASLYGIGPNATGVAPSAIAVPRCVLRSTGSNYSMTANQWNPIAWTVEHQDSDNMHDGTNPTRITFRTAGMYHIVGNGQIFGGVASNKSWRIQRSNGLTLAQSSITNVAANDHAQSLSAQEYFAVGDYVTFEHHPGAEGGSFTLGTLCNFSATMAEGIQGPPGPSTAIPLVSALPATPVDGQEVYYLADAANGVIWHLRYRASSASAYKWEYVGGPPLYHFIGTAEGTTTVGTWLNLASNGPLITVPLAGDYSTRFSAGFFASVANQGGQMGVAVGDTTPVVPNPGTIATLSNAWATSSAAEGRIQNVSANAVLKLRYYSGYAGTATWKDRQLSVVPVRVG